MWFLLAHGALAQDVPAFNVQLFRPSVDAGNMLWTDDAARARNRQLTGRALLSYTADPLLYTYSDGEQVAVVSDVVQADMLGAYTLGRFRIGADVPIYLFADGSIGSEAGLGDISADGRISILHQPVAPLGLALATRIGLPTASVETALGSAGATWEVSAIVDKRIERLALALNLGTRGLPEAQLEDVVWNDQFFFRGGGAFELSEQLGLSAELAGNLTYGAVAEIQGRPVEALLGGWYRPGNQNLVVRYGIGSGLTNGVGSPTLRTLLAIAYEPPTGIDADEDGIVDSRDACPQAPEDLDSYEDRDGCPDPTIVTFRAIDAHSKLPLREAFTVAVDGTGQPDSTVAMVAGGHDVTLHAEGFVPSTSRIQIPGGAPYTLDVPMDAILPGKLVVRVQDTNGLPVEGAEWFLDGQPQGGIGNIAARVDMMPGSYRISASAEGHLKTSKVTNIRSELDATVELILQPTTVQVSEERIDLGGKIYFETGNATIKPESFPLLTEVVTVMSEYPEIRSLRIEGHTDARGAASDNQVLSEQRAAAVAQFLTEQGVSAERLSSIGYGESQPIDRRQSSSAHERNRRVDFFVEEWRPTASEAEPAAEDSPAP